MIRLLRLERAAALLLLAASPRRAVAQTTEPRPAVATIAGEVLDAESERPLPKSTVVLRLVGEGAIVSAGTAPPTIVSLARSLVTDDSGHYRFAGLATGRYQLHVQRLGYRPANVEVELQDDAARVSVGMVVVPVRLSPMPVNADREPSFATQGTTRNDSVESNARVLAARARQARYASSDVREITDADLVETGSLGETDLFRALQRLPGVTTTGDDGIELWTRGMRWDETRVYFDGVPLFTPYHLGGGQPMTGLGTDVIGSAILFPGVRPAAIGDGASVLDLRTRPTVPDGRLRGVTELSSLGGRVALGRGDSAGGGWSLAARHRVGDLLSEALHRIWDPTARPNYREYYSDISARWDHPLSTATQLQVSGLYSADQVPTLLSSDNFAARATLDHAGGGLTTSTGIAASGYRGTGTGREAFAMYLIDPTAIDTIASRVWYVALTGTVRPTQVVSGMEWSAGYAISATRARSAGEARLVRDSSLDRRTLGATSTAPMVSLWGERRQALADWLDLTLGGRVDIGKAAATRHVRPMPHAEVRATVDSRTTVSAALGRFYQYEQAVVPATSVLATSTISPLWRIADDSTPALRVDAFTIGVERWARDGWLLGATGYARLSAGVICRDPRLNPLATGLATVVGRERGQGIELSARKLVGRVTGSFGYTLATSRVTAAGVAYDADEDRRQSVDATSMMALTRHMRLGAAASWMSGVPLTAVRISTTAPTGGGQFEARAGPPNALRSRPHGNADLFADWSDIWWRERTGLFVQVLNVIPQRGSGYGYPRPAPCTSTDPRQSCANSIVGVDERGTFFGAVFGIRYRF